MWDPSGHWGSKTHRKITKRAIKRVNKKFIKKLTGEKFKKLIGKKKREELIASCTLPDRARAGKTKKTKVCGMSLVRKGYGKWHGKNKKKLAKLKDKVEEKLILSNYSIKKNINCWEQCCIQFKTIMLIAMLCRLLIIRSILKNTRTIVLQ